MTFGNSSFLELDGQRFLRQGSLFIELQKVLEKKLNIKDLMMQDHRKINLSYADFHDALSETCDNLHEQAWNQALETFGPYVGENEI